MHVVAIKVFPIARTKINWPAIMSWLEHLGVKAPSSVRRQLARGSEPEQLVALCGKRCYNSFEPKLNPNVAAIRTDLATYIENILKSGHGSVFEHATFSFAIEGLSRVATSELNRHRAGVAISEGSMRYIRFNDLEFWMPKSLTQTKSRDATEAKRRRQTAIKLKQAFSTTEKIYLDLCNIWQIEEMTDFSKKKQLTSLFRRIVGMGIASGGVWTFNARALRHIIALRTTMHAEEEIQHVFNLIAESVVESDPLLFGDFSRNEKGEWVPMYQTV